MKEIIGYCGEDPAQTANELSEILALLKKFNRPDIGKLVQEILDTEEHERILQDFQTPVEPMEK